MGCASLVTCPALLASAGLGARSRSRSELALTSWAAHVFSKASEALRVARHEPGAEVRSVSWSSTVPPGARVA
jgi:hypothetical protein